MENNNQLPEKNGKNSTEILLTETEIAQCLALAMIKAGIPTAKMPEGMERNVLINFVSKNYGKITVKQFNEAFELAYLGKLEVDANLYDKFFSCAYVSRILEAYKKYLLEDYYKKLGYIVTPGHLPIKKLN